MDKAHSDPAWDQRQLQDMLANVLDHVGAAIYMKDVDGCYRYGNRMTFEHFGLPRESVIGKRDRDLLPAGFAAEIERLDREVIESGVPQQGEETLPDASGVERHYWSVKVPLRREGETPLVVGFSTDITVLYQLRMELLKQSITDDLTGLYNRRFLFETLNKELSRARRQKLHTTLLLIDLDHFKHVNDRFGHPVGDRALQEFSHMLQHNIRIEDTAARVGGDEFAILLPDSDPDAAMTIAERIRARTAELQMASDSGEVLGITVSIGLIHVHEGAGTPEMLYAEADQLLYKAKQAGRNSIGTRN